MAGDWIKMRVWLGKDPKVIAIADYLATHRRFMDWMSDPVRRTCSVSVYEHVTRDVTVRVTVTGLLQVWGVTRTDGHMDGDDLVVNSTSPDTLDEIAGFPGLGAAMESVGWAVYDSETHRTIFPKFFLHNAPTDELKRFKDTERKRKQREKQRDMSQDCPRDSHANVTHRAEQSRAEQSRGDNTGDRCSCSENSIERSIVKDWCAKTFGTIAVARKQKQLSSDKRTRELLYRIGVLTLTGRVPEALAADGAEGLREVKEWPSNPGGWLRRKWQGSKYLPSGVDLNQLLMEVTLPDDM